MQDLRSIFITGLALIFSLYGQSQNLKAPERGILDLRNYELNEHSYIKLNGEWEFYWESFVSPDEFKSPTPPKPTLYGEVPAYWTDYSDDNFSFPGKGFASYRLSILLPRGFDQEIGFNIPVFDDAFTLFLNEAKVWSNGQPGISEDLSDPGYQPGTFTFKPGLVTLQILIHVSNFQHRRGGFWKSMQIGFPSMISKIDNKNRLISFISFGVLLAFSLFFLFFFLFYPKDKMVLSFSIVLAGVFIRLMNTGLYPVNYFLDISWDWIIRLEYLGTFLAFGAALWYFYRLFPSRYMLWITRVNTLLVIFSAIIILFLKVRVFAYTMLYFQPAIIILMLYYLIACIVSINRGKRDDLFFLAGMVIFLAALVNDIMLANSLTALSNSYIIHFALQVFVFLQAILIIRKWVRASTEREQLMNEIEYINKNLEILVDERTLELNERNTEIQKKNKHIEARNTDLKKALDFKNWVFSIIAHDLKSPIASLVQNSALLDYNLSQEENKKLIAAFRELSSSALDLIDNLLYWGRSQGAQISYKPEMLDLKPVIEAVFKLFGEMAKQKSISLEFKAEGKTTAFADKELLEIVCRNLISNAIKFTERSGKVTVHVSSMSGNDNLMLRFQDNGIGLPEDMMKGILSNTEMISTYGTDKERGTGLGLKLCHELVLVNKGVLRIESKEGQGTTVFVSIPATPPDAEDS